MRLRRRADAAATTPQEFAADTFQVPSFYMPFHARVNPHLRGVRPRVRSWARSLGLLEAQHADSRHGGWSAEVFDRADFTAFTALTYPHASAGELELLPGWHSVIWCLDDVFLPWCEDLEDREQILRRDYGAAGCSALLMEHSLGWEIPEDIRQTRPFTVLIDAFRDTIDLHNHIVSYPKEVREGVARNSIVQVALQLYDIPFREAVSVVNRILTGRVRTLDETVRTDLPQSLHDLRVDRTSGVPCSGMPTPSRVGRRAPIDGTWTPIGTGSR